MMQQRDDSDPDHERVARYSRMVWHGGTHSHDRRSHFISHSPIQLYLCKPKAKPKINKRASNLCDLYPIEFIFTVMCYQGLRESSVSIFESWHTSTLSPP